MADSNGHPAHDVSRPSQIPAATWRSPGSTAYDFRSDTVTTPTLSMLRAIEASTLADDVFAEDPTTIALEALVARLTGHEAGLLVTSGTMGNQVAIRAALRDGPPHAVLCDARAHVLRHEAGGCASLSQAMVMGVRPSNGVYLTPEDVERAAELDEDVHGCPTRVVSLENTLGGAVMPLDDLQRTARWCKERDIHVHLDGARLWEAVAAGVASPLSSKISSPSAPTNLATLRTAQEKLLHAYASTVSSASLCFSKGLGAPLGSILVGSRAFIARARWVRKSIGGGTRQSGIVAAAAAQALSDTFFGGLLAATHRTARRIESAWRELGGRVELPVDTNMVWLDLPHAGVEAHRFVEEAGREGLRVLGGRVVVHYQICEDAVSRLEGVMRRVFAEGQQKRTKRGVDGEEHEVRRPEAKKMRYAAKVDDDDR